LGLLWIGAAATLTAVIAAVRLGGARRIVGFQLARRVGVLFVVLTVLWMAFMGWLAAIGGGPLLALFLTMAATGPTLMLAVGICAQGLIRSPWVALIPPLAVLLLSAASTIAAIYIGVGRV